MNHTQSLYKDWRYLVLFSPSGEILLIMWGMSTQKNRLFAISGNIDRFQKLGCRYVFWVYTFVKIQQIVHSKYAHYIAYSLCINNVDLKMIPILVCIKRNILSQSGEMLILLKMNEVAMADHSLETLEKAKR